MSELISFIIGALLGGGAVWLALRKQTKHSHILENMRMLEKPAKKNKAGNLAEFNQSEKQRINENKQKILGLLDSQDRITNNDVEKFLGISDATATRYLDELEKEGALKQVADTGRGVYYKKP